jgi:hypothetical protein
LTVTGSSDWLLAIIGNSKSAAAITRGLTGSGDKATLLALVLVLEVEFLSAQAEAVIARDATVISTKSECAPACLAPESLMIFIAFQHLS